MTPGPIEKLKPYFKPRPRAPRKPPQAPTAPPQPAAQIPPAAQPNAAAAQAVAPQPATPPPPAVPAQPAAPAVDPGLERTRAQLAARYAALQFDLGGLVYEMAIRDSFRLDVVTRRAAELQAVDAQLNAAEQRLGLAAPPSCPSCGAPAQVGARFCGRCGSTLTGIVSPPSTPDQQPRQQPPSANGPTG